MCQFNLFNLAIWQTAFASDHTFASFVFVSSKEFKQNEGNFELICEVEKELNVITPKP